MRSLILIITLLFSMSIFAEQKFTDADVDKIMKDLKAESEEFKTMNQGKFDLVKMKPIIIQGLDEYNINNKFTKKEMIQIKEKLEKFMQNPADNNNEEKFIKEFEAGLKEIAAQKVPKQKQGQICNEISCDKDLKCAMDPKQDTEGKSCLAGAKECKVDSDCCSDFCVDSTRIKGKKLCEPIRRCYQPKKLGESCLNSPVCEQGTCLPFDMNTIGIGECRRVGLNCKSNNDCCSSSCVNRKCEANSVCKNCVPKGDKAEDGKKCCEGLYKGVNGICTPDMPPIIPPQVKLEIKKSFRFIASIFIENARADFFDDIGEFFDPSTGPDVANVSATSSAAYSEVNSNRSKYSNYVAQSSEKDKIDFKKAASKMDFATKSNFDKCDMNFREDFYNYLKNTNPDIKNPNSDPSQNLFDQELALTAFDFVASGELNADYWRTSKNNDTTSINGRLAKVAEKHLANKSKMNDKIAEIDRKLTCMCIEVVGLKKLDESKGKYFDEKCPEFHKSTSNSSQKCDPKLSNGDKSGDIKCDQKKSSCDNLASEQKAYTDACGNGPTAGMTAADCENLKTNLSTKEKICSTNSSDSFIDDVASGDASGVKAKRMMVYFTSQMSAFNQTLTVDNTRIYTGIASVRDWLADNANNKLRTATELKEVDLGDFTLNGFGGTAQAMGAGVLAALLAASVIAVLGGFAANSIISAWVALNIITATAVTAGGGVWMIASLKGAWINKRPVVTDQFLRTQSCGKKGKHTCTDWKRKLNQPYNNVCDAHISANACVKNFLVFKHNSKVNDSEEFRYIVDPFIPAGVSKGAILRGQGDYVQNLENGYNQALGKMQSKSLHGTISENYMWLEFIDSEVVGLYAPKLGAEPEREYFLNNDIINAIKAKAKAFAVEKKFLKQTDVKNLDIFADYALDIHFKWPKTTLRGEISYPTAALDTYLEYMANGVAAKLTAGGANAALTFGGLNSKYLEDYLNTLKIYEEQGTNLSPDQKSALRAEIAKTQNELTSMKLISNIASNGSEIDKAAIDAALNRGGTNGGSLTSEQSDFLQAIGTYRKLRNEQIKKAEAYKKAVSNGEISQARAARVTKISSLVNSKIGTPLSGLSMNSNGTTSTMSDSGSALSTGKSAITGSGYNSYSSGSYGSSGSSGKSNYNSNKTTSDVPATNSVEDEDSKKLTEAINARDSQSASKFQSDESNSLFEKVTNAYIRNYDKVLTKKNKEQDLKSEK